MRYLIALLCGSAVFGSTYNVKTPANGGADSNTCIQAQSASTPKATPASALSCMATPAGGDTVIVFAGTYSGNLTIPAGSANSYNTLTVNGADVANLTGTVTLDSHTKQIGFVQNHLGGPVITCATLNGSATDVVIQANTYTSCSTININSGNSFIHIIGNTLSYAGSPGPPISCTNGVGTNCTGRMFNVLGSNNLLENNDISHCQICIVYGNTTATTQNAMRNNTFHDLLESEAGSNGHVDAIFSEPAGATSFTLIEGNNERNAVGVDAKGWLSQNDAGCGSTCTDIISRYNILNSIGSGVVTNDKSWPNVMHYNNTISDADRSTGGGDSDNLATAPGAAVLNNIYYYTMAISVTPYECRNCVAFGHSIAFSTVASTFFGRNTSGSFATEPGNQVIDPKFVNYVALGSASNNFHLQGTSPALGAGTNLTTVSSGCGTNVTSLTLANPHFFQDGMGDTSMGVQPDWIRVGAAGAPVVQIAAGGINYSTGVVTLASAITCAGTPNVYLYKKSDGSVVLPQGQGNPDIGALPNVSSVSLSNSPASINFGNVLQNTTSAGTVVTVSNVGSANAASIACSFTGPQSAQYTFTGTCPGSLASGGSFQLTVFCAPGVTSGTLNANLSINDSVDGVSSSTTLSCNAVAPGPVVSISPTSGNFGNVNINTTSAALAFTVTNTGNSGLTWTSVAASSSFSVQSNTCNGTTVANGSCAIQATCSPGAVTGNISGTLTLTTNASTSPDQVNLSCTGVNPNAPQLLSSTSCGPALSPLSCTIPSTSSGDLIAVLIATAVNFAPTSYTITDNKSNGYGEASITPGAAQSIDANTGAATDIYYCHDCASGATSLTIAPSTVGTMAACVLRFSGVNHLDQTAVINSHAASTAPVGAQVTTNSSAEVVTSVVSVQGGVNSVVSPFLSVCPGLFGNGWAYQIVSSTGSYAASMTSTNGTYSSSTASFDQSQALPNSPGGVNVSGPAGRGVVR